MGGGKHNIRNCVKGPHEALGQLRSIGLYSHDVLL